MKRTDNEILHDLRRVEAQLSPENLTCDGELPRSAWRAKAQKLNTQYANLLKELGREPTTQELYGQ